MTVMRKLTLLLLCLALGIGVCDAKKKNRGVYFRTDAEIVLDKPYFGLNVSNMIHMGRVFRCTKEYSRSSTVRCDNATS